MPRVASLTPDLLWGVKVLIRGGKFDPMILNRGQQFDPESGVIGLTLDLIWSIKAYPV